MADLPELCAGWSVCAGGGGAAPRTCAEVGRDDLVDWEAVRDGLADVDAAAAPHVEEERPRAVLAEFQQLTVHREPGYLQSAVNREISADVEKKGGGPTY